ncbi:MAG TPA: NADH-quinone oxidoreductase subunit J [Chryseosolibacter sp.]|nr:NADH-quinone oxidoreductase subunit J [Chryseosolibacter sp.]
MITFYVAATIAVFSTIMVITRYNMIHALLYLVVSFLAVAIVFYVLGAPFMAALEIIVYAGAIVVLIIFVIMMLNLKQESVEQERAWMGNNIFIGPGILSFILLAEIIYMITSSETNVLSEKVIEPKEVGITLYGPYAIGVELCGILLMSGIVGAYHLGRQKKKVVHRFLESQES